MPAFTAVEAMQALGVSPSDFEQIRKMPQHEAQEWLKMLKDRARKRYRALAKELHPDQNGGDTAKTAKFRLVTSMLADLNKLEVPSKPPTAAKPKSKPVSKAPSWVAAVRAYDESLKKDNAVYDPNFVVTMKPS